MFSRCKRAVVAALTIWAAVAPVSSYASDELKVGGTGSAMATIDALAEAYRRHVPDFKLKLVPNLGSSGGLKALSAGAVDFALISRVLKPAEAATGLTAYTYGRSPFVLVTNKPDIRDLTSARLADMLATRAAVWADGTPVRLVLRPTADADSFLLGEFSPGIKLALAAAHARGGMVLAVTDQESADQSERLPGSLGTSSLALLKAEKRSLHVLSVDGVEPTLANLASGAYPHAKTMAIVVRGEASAEVRKFLGFIESDEARTLLESLGHLTESAR